MSGGYIIEANGLRKTFGSVTALESVDLQVERGTVLGLLGPNGAGKTTMVRILSTLLKADGGRAAIAGYDLDTQPRQVRKVIGLTGQETSVDPLLTGRENLVMMGRLFHLGAAVAERRAAELLERFGLVEAADRQVGTYSGGMRRRLDLAVSLVSSPQILFLDEPTTGLDPTSRMALWEMIEDLVSAGTTILLTTQYLEEADRLAGRIAVLNGGRIVADGTPYELKRQVGEERAELTVRADDLTRTMATVGGESIDERTVSVAVNGPDDVRGLLNRLADAGVEVVRFALHQPTLDDVFRTLTSKTTEGAK
ncbi:ATP-binding cassette domain-containing protein [Thermoactinospora rubra]|uniref:ATP-binding cassette domain-containing protein n=1 Tax=Thermoactinospora rubra TaxID=1088767 RepID=UPI000A11993E|nr:ATP-binding cassette domain-containing protein [Thermoactinospora rubra]